MERVLKDVVAADADAEGAAVVAVLARAAHLALEVAALVLKFDQPRGAQQRRQAALQQRGRLLQQRVEQVAVLLRKGQEGQAPLVQLLDVLILRRAQQPLRLARPGLRRRGLDRRGGRARRPAAGVPALGHPRRLLGKLTQRGLRVRQDEERLDEGQQLLRPRGQRRGAAPLGRRVAGLRPPRRAGALARLGDVPLHRGDALPERHPQRAQALRQLAKHRPGAVHRGGIHGGG
mmetsp:Transcript_16609/g.43075  ORF Transcript_16609/g.43075 Transcript_16609/m.43075 type:complete len:233 (+) Transcript_16609:1201-1899(+)